MQLSAAGDCYDNAVAESVFATLKKELVHRCVFQTRTEGYDAISDYIENYYNAKRRHSAAENQSPIAFELAHGKQLAASFKLSNCPEFPETPVAAAIAVARWCRFTALLSEMLSELDE